MRPDGAWATTRETVAALHALLAATAVEARGTVVVELAGRDPIRVPIDDDVLVDLGRWTESDELTVRFDGSGTPWANLSVRGTVVRAPETGGAAALVLAVTWPGQPLRIGQAAVADVEISNASSEPISSPMVVVPLPGGIAVDRAALERAAKAAGIPFVEVEDGNVLLYLDALAPDAHCKIAIPFGARCLGSFATGTATAYPYYQPDVAIWVAGRRIEVRAE
jgi:hypothetical protein